MQFGTLQTVFTVLLHARTRTHRHTRSFPLIQPSVPSRKVPLGDIDPRTSSTFSILRQIVHNPTIRSTGLRFWQSAPEPFGPTIPSVKNIFDNHLVWEKVKSALKPLTDKLAQRAGTESLGLRSTRAQLFL